MLRPQPSRSIAASPPTTVMAVGTLGDPAEMTDVIRERETAPRARRAAAESVLVNA